MASDTDDGWETMRREQDDGSTENYNRYELLAWVKASDHRKDILTTLQDGPENMTHFKEKWDVATADVPRRYINELQNRGLVECLTSDRQRYRLYGLTDDGEDLAESLKFGVRGVTCPRLVFKVVQVTSTLAVAKITIWCPNIRPFQGSYPPNFGPG